MIGLASMHRPSAHCANAMYSPHRYCFARPLPHARRATRTRWRVFTRERPSRPKHQPSEHLAQELQQRAGPTVEAVDSLQQLLHDIDALLYIFPGASTSSPSATYAIVVPAGQDPYLVTWRQTEGLINQPPLDVQIEHSAAAVALCQHRLQQQLPRGLQEADLVAVLQLASQMEGQQDCAAACCEQLAGMPDLSWQAVRVLLDLPGEQYSSWVGVQLNDAVKQALQQQLGDLDAVLASKAKGQQLQQLPLLGLELLLRDTRTQMKSVVVPLTAIQMWGLHARDNGMLTESEERRLIALMLEAGQGRNFILDAATDGNGGGAADDGSGSTGTSASASISAGKKRQQKQPIASTTVARLTAPALSPDILWSTAPLTLSPYYHDRPLGEFTIRGCVRVVYIGPYRGLYYLEPGRVDARGRPERFYVTRLFTLGPCGTFLIRPDYNGYSYS